MSIPSQLNRINNNVQSTLGIIANAGVEVGANSDALPTAAADLANEKQDKLTFDTTPKSGSTNPVTSGGIYTALSGKAPAGNYAGSSSAGGAATSVNVTNTTPTAATTYYPLYATGVSGTQNVRANADLYYYDAGSWAYLNIGSTNQVGGLTLHHSGGHYANLATTSLTANRDITLPDVSGTVITTGNLPTFYGVCSTASDDAAKTVQIDGFKLVEGAQVTIKFTNANGITSPTLNVSGTGAYPMMRYGDTAISTATTTSGWSAGAVQTFTFDGEAWVREYWYNTTYSNAALGCGYGTCSTAAATVAKTASLSSYSLTTNGVVAIRFTNDVPAGATLNINSKGAKAIYHRNAAIKAGVIKAGDIATFVYSTYYRLISIDRPQAEKSTTATATLSASGWSNGSYTLSVSGVTTTSNQEILPALDITAEQLAALQVANIQDGGQSEGKIILKAFGTVPTINIPIRIIVRGDL